MSGTRIQPTPEKPPAVNDEKPNEATNCTNCDTALQGQYCSVCGQRNEPLRQPIGRFLKEAFVEFVGVDGRLWSSLKLLLFRPGWLTKAYLNGQRVRFIRPLRLYLIASLLFFFLLTVIDPAGLIDGEDIEVSSDSTVTVENFLATLEEQRNAGTHRLASQQALVDSLEMQFQHDSLAFAANSEADTDTLQAQKDALDDLRDKRNDERGDLESFRRHLDRENKRRTWKAEQIAQSSPDSLIRPADLDRAAELLFEDGPSGNLNVGLPDWWPQSEAVRRMRNARTDDEMQSALVAFLRDTLRRLPTVMFLMLPMFALLLKLLYLRRGWYYSEHLVFGLHTHAFAFALFTVMLLMTWGSNGAVWANITTSVLSVLFPIYFYIAQKHVYGQGWLKTGVKFWMLGWMYFLVLSVGIVLVVLLAASF